MEDTKATVPVVIDIQEITTIADFFVIASADNTVQVQAICRRISDALLDNGVRVKHVEGYESSGWILMDYGSVVVHVFYQPLRSYYALEDLWGDARRVQL